jgi:ketosteroid isomerase-like protein
VKALRAKDVNGLMSYYAPEIPLFDFAPPLQYRGADVYRKNWEEWLTSFQGPVGYEIRDLSITAGDDEHLTSFRSFCSFHSGFLTKS